MRSGKSKVTTRGFYLEENAGVLVVGSRRETKKPVRKEKDSTGG